MSTQSPSSAPSSASAAADDRSQPVLNVRAAAAVFLVVTVEPGGEPVARDLLAGLAGLVRSFGFGHPDGGLTCVAGIGSAAWDRLFGAPRPAALHPFPELAGHPAVRPRPHPRLLPARHRHPVLRPPSDFLEDIPDRRPPRHDGDGSRGERMTADDG